MAANIATTARQTLVASFTDLNTNYTVTEGASPGRPWMCDCKGWIFARVDPGTGYKKNCKHIVAVQAANAQGFPVATATPKRSTKAAPAKRAEVTVEVAGERLRVTRPEPKAI